MGPCRITAPHRKHAIISTAEGLTAPGLLLIDSGAQYLGGTTDITRVWAIGEPARPAKRDFTLVLERHMGLSRMRFPARHPGPDARRHCPRTLWEQGWILAMAPATVWGYFSTFNEGPQSISKPFDLNMAIGRHDPTSIEPGLYRPAQWGFALKTCAQCGSRRQPCQTPNQHARMRRVPGVQTLSLCPIDTRCIDLSLAAHR